MTLTKCENGHYFNMDKYDACPVCGAKIMKGLAKTGKRTESKPAPVAPPPQSKPAPAPAPMAAPTPAPAPVPVPDVSDEKTVAEPVIFVSAPVEETVTNIPALEDDPDNDRTRGYFEVIPENVMPPSPEPPAPNVAPKAEEPSDLSEEIRKLQAESEGRTIGFFSTVQPSAVSPTSRAVEGPSEPMVGWLVAVKGVNRGRAYSIYSGRNSVGRNSSNRIQITGDQRISREKHTWIIYDPRSREFSIKEGDSSGLTYVNDVRVSSEIILKPYSVIEIGDSQLLFVPLCGENFSWEMYK